MSLPDDITRCPGTDHAQCRGCRRREPLSGGHGSFMCPDHMEITRVGYCAHRIPARTEVELAAQQAQGQGGE